MVVTKRTHASWLAVSRRRLSPGTSSVGCSTTLSTSRIAGSLLTTSSAAISAVEESEEFAQAAGCLALPELAWPIARAVVAVILAAHRLDEPGLAPAASLDGKVRDAVVTALANALAPPTRTLTGWTLKANVEVRRGREPPSAWPTGDSP